MPQSGIHLEVISTSLVISTARRNLSFVFVSTELTTRSLAGVYAEFNEVFEMTDWGITTTKKNRDVAEDFSPPLVF
jgi:hypothetical protein